MVEFGDGLEITYVMGGLAREFEDDLSSLVINWLDDAAESGMPIDPRVWHHDGVRSTYPACIAFRAAAEQGTDAAGRYLRVLREGFMCHGRKLDGPEALVTEARRAGLDAQRFRIDLESNAILEAFAGDLEETRTIPDGAREAGLATEGSHGSSVERLAFPALRLIPDVDGLRSNGWAATTPTKPGARPRSQRGPRRWTSLVPTWPQRSSDSGAWPPRSSRRCATSRDPGRGRRCGASRASGGRGACRY